MDDAALITALEEHPTIDPIEGGYTVSNAVLDNEITIAYGDLVVHVRMPTIDEIVLNDDPSAIVVDGWFDAIARQLSDANGVVKGELTADASVTRGQTEVSVTYRLRGTDADGLAMDAKALVDFVIGMYLQSAIPGYEYDDPMRGLLGAARARGRSDVER